MNIFHDTHVSVFIYLFVVGCFLHLLFANFHKVLDLLTTLILLCWDAHCKLNLMFMNPGIQQLLSLFVDFVFSVHS